MRWFPIAAAGLLLFASGCSIVVKNELDEKPEPDAGVDEFCRGQINGFDCSTPSEPNRICVDLRCVERRCGDGYIDSAAVPAEACDDANDVSNDGCESDCTLTCVSAEDCDDGDICNGDEACGLNNLGLPACGADPGVLLPPLGTPCTTAGDGGVVGACNANGVCEQL